MSNQTSADWVTLAAHGGALLGAKFSCELRIQHLNLRVKKNPRVIPCWVVVFLRLFSFRVWKSIHKEGKLFCFTVYISCLFNIVFWLIWCVKAGHPATCMYIYNTPRKRKMYVQKIVHKLCCAPKSPDQGAWCPVGTSHYLQWRIGEGLDFSLKKYCKQCLAKKVLNEPRMLHVAGPCWETSFPMD